MIRASRHLSLSLFVVLLLACGGTPPAEQSPSPAASPVPSPTGESSPVPTGEPLPSPQPTGGEQSPEPTPAGPTPTAAARPTPSFVAGPTPGPDGWLGPLRIAQREYQGMSLVVDGSGVAHAAAALDGGIFYLTNASGSWTRERVSRPPGSGRNARLDDDPSIAIDSDGSLYIAFTRLGPDDTFGRLPEGILWTSNQNGSWSTAAELAGLFSNSPSIAVRNGSVHVAYVDGIPFDVIDDEASFPVRYMTNVSGSWTDEMVLDNGSQPVLRLGTDGRAHILFGDIYGLLVGNGLRYAEAGTATGSFSVELIPSTYSDELPASFALDSSNRPQVVLTPSDDPGLRFTRRSGTAWDFPAPVLAEGSAQYVGSATDANGALHVIVSTNRDGVWYLTNRGGSFQTRQLSTGRAGAADIAIDSAGRPHVIFIVGRSGSRELWYGVGPTP